MLAKKLKVSETMLRRAGGGGLPWAELNWANVECGGISMPQRRQQEPGHVNEQLSSATAALRQALAWWIAAEMVRRHPKALVVRGSDGHHGPALLICRKPEPSSNGGGQVFIPLGRNFGVVASGSGESVWIGGADALLAGDRRTEVVGRLKEAIALPSRPATPPTVNESIGPRLIAAFLQRTALERERWWMTSGAGEDQDYGIWDMGQGLFEAMPQLAQDVANHERPDHSEPPEARYWFLRPIIRGRHGQPVVAIDTTAGVAWSTSERMPLMTEYHKLDRSLDRLVSRVLPPAF